PTAEPVKDFYSTAIPLSRSKITSINRSNSMRSCPPVQRTSPQGRWPNPKSRRCQYGYQCKVPGDGVDFRFLYYPVYNPLVFLDGNVPIGLGGKISCRPPGSLYSQADGRLFQKSLGGYYTMSKNKKPRPMP